MALFLKLDANIASRQMVNSNRFQASVFMSFETSNLLCEFLTTLATSVCDVDNVNCINDIIFKSF